MIACATKHIHSLSKMKVQAMNRSDVESNLDFVGFIIFENKLKLASTAVITELNDAGIRKVMCTGDNILTAISVSRECHLIDRMAHCFVPHFYQGIVFIPNLSYYASAEPFNFCKAMLEILMRDSSGKVWITHYWSSMKIHFLYEPTEVIISKLLLNLCSLCPHLPKATLQCFMKYLVFEISLWQ